MSRRRRHFSRVRAQRLVAHLHLDGRLSGGGPVENISAGGLLMRTGQQLPSGTPLQLDLVRPGMKKPFRLSGFVVGQARSQSGSPTALRIRFDLGADANALRLHALLGELGLRELTEPPPPAPPASLPPRAPAAARAPQARALVPPVLLPQAPSVSQAPATPVATAPSAATDASVHVQLQALRNELQQARAQVARHEGELAELRARLRAQRP